MEKEMPTKHKSEENESGCTHTDKADFQSGSTDLECICARWQSLYTKQADGTERANTRVGDFSMPLLVIYRLVDRKPARIWN